VIKLEESVNVLRERVIRVRDVLKQIDRKRLS
jgi:hypothetical protein